MSGRFVAAIHDHAVVRAEAVHLHEHRVERLVRAALGGHAARVALLADGVDLVDEDDAGGVLLALLEEVAHAARAHAHEHLLEVGAADRVEGHLRLAGDGLGEEGLARAGRPHEEDAARDARAELRELLRVLQELHDLRHVLLGLIDARDVLERHLAGALVLVHQPRARLAEGEHAARAAAHHLAVDEEPHERGEDAEDEELLEEGAEQGLLLLHGAAHVLRREEVHERFVLAGDERDAERRAGGVEKLAPQIGARAVHHAHALDAFDLAAFDPLPEFRQGELKGLGLVGGKVAGTQEYGQDDGEDDPATTGPLRTGRPRDRTRPPGGPRLFFRFFRHRRKYSMKLAFGLCVYVPFARGRGF